MGIKARSRTQTRRPSPSRRRAAVLVGLILAGLLVASPRAGGAFDGGGARTFELQRDLRTLRPRVERAPRAAAYDLSNLERRLHDRRIDASRDPRLPGLEIEARRLRWQADRNARPPMTADRSRTPALAAAAPLAKPGYLGGAHALSGMPMAALPLGWRVVALQRQIGQIEERLERADAAAAARLIELAEADLTLLRGASSDTVADDPNLMALQRRLDALRQRLD